MCVCGREGFKKKLRVLVVANKVSKRLNLRDCEFCVSLCVEVKMCCADGGTKAVAGAT